LLDLPPNDQLGINEELDEEDWSGEQIAEASDQCRLTQSQSLSVRHNLAISCRIEAVWVKTLQDSKPAAGDLQEVLGKASPLFEIASVLMCFNHFASFIVNANHSAM
jgi:hypothetical protein